MKQSGVGSSVCGLVGLGLAVLVAVVAFISVVQAQDVPQAERNALLDVYEGTGGSVGKWKRNDNWNTQNSTCQWYGITCETASVNGTNSTHVVEM